MERPQSVTVPKKLKDRVIIYGIHMDDESPLEQKKVFKFWASVKLMQQYPLEGDIVNVRTKYGKRQIMITDLAEYSEDLDKPEKIATNLYEGEKYQDLEIDIEKSQGKRA